jgi:thiol-disulfide isomerase/thioredoxin
MQPDHLFTQELCAAADKNVLPVMIGDAMPDYPLPLVAGDTVMLRQILGKRLTIVDIWASWCAPCRKENRFVMAPLWSGYKDQGLQIVGYSIDRDGSAWKAAIEKDGATWINASHLTGDATPFLERLRISTIPANFILDEKGNILAKNVFGQELVRLVKAKLE